VFKKLDVLILRTFIGPFIATFIIMTFVLVMQFFWLWIDDFIGKGIDTFTILKLVMYIAATTLPLALPISILLSSIMTFGNLGESFELVAIKSAGIPLLRFMRPLIVVSLIISGIAFFFNNNVIPVVTLKFEALKTNLVLTKPALDIKEGIFYDKIENFVIKVARKDKDGPGIYDVVIYEKGNPVQDNIITAQSGIMQISENKRFLEFILKNGTRYEEKGFRGVVTNDYIRLGFSEYKKTIDISSFDQLKNPDSLFKNNARMMTVPQLNISIDSMRPVMDSIAKRMSIQTLNFFKFNQYFDSGSIQKTKPYRDEITSIKQIIPDSAYMNSMDGASTKINTAKSTMDLLYNDFFQRNKDYRSYNIEWHRKFALSISCFVLFLIGAPLGSIIRKGGLGTPLVFAIIFFVFFYLINSFGEKFVKEGSLEPYQGMWISTMVLVPIGVFLTYKAMRDSQLFNKEYYFRAIKTLRARVEARRKKNNA
jgi:lipopolysaccharide export system permease protein